MDWSGISGSSAKSSLVREGNTVNALMAMLCSSPQPAYFRGLEGRLSSGTSLKRPLFPSSDVDGLVEDDITDHHEQSIHVEKKRRLTVEQVRCLEKSFEEENKLETERKLQLAQELSLQPRQVAVWFQNRRARWKAKQLEQDYDILQMEYDALLLEKKKLEAEVFSLTDKLAAKEQAESKTGRGNNSGSFDSQQYSCSDIQTSLNTGNQVIVSSELHTSSSPVTEEARSCPIQPSIEEYSPQSDIYNSQLLDAGSPNPVDTSLDTQESAGIVFEHKTRNNHTLQALTYYPVGEEGPYVSLHNNQVYEQIACKLENGLFYDGHEYHHSNTPEEPAFLAWWYSP